MPRTPVAPVRWTPPPPGPELPSTPPSGARVYETSGYGTEDVVVRADGHVLTAVEDGRLLAIDPDTSTESVLATLPGRPLGIEHHPAGGYVICDAYKGLFHLHADGTLESLVDSIDGVPMVFCNNAAVANDGTIYFTDSSTKFDFEQFEGDLFEHVPTGRLFKRTTDGSVHLLADGLSFANGVTLASDESFLVVAETAGYCLNRLWLRGDRAGDMEPFGPILPGFPDNISTGEDGNIWVAIPTARDAILDLLLPKAPVLRKIIWRLPHALQPKPKNLISVLAFDAAGELVHNIQGKIDGFGKATGVRQVGGSVWLGSFQQTTIAVLDVP